MLYLFVYFRNHIKQAGKKIKGADKTVIVLIVQNK